MGHDSNEASGFVFEYYNEDDSTQTLFQSLTSTITENTSEITGFRIELDTNEPVDVALDDFLNQQSTPENAGTTSMNESTERRETDSAPSNRESSSVPSLQNDALPARVLSTMLDRDEDSVRTSDLEEEFEDDEIDTARISQTLASLKRRDLVAAEPDPDDKRANLYWPTAQGQQALNH